MKTINQNISGEILRWQKKLFALSIRRRMRLQKIREMLGVTSGQRCLEITAGDGMISQSLRMEGGSWMTLVPTEAVRESLSYFVREDLYAIQDGKIDSPDNEFDAVVIVDALEWIKDDTEFIKECHRVLKTSGRLIITAARRTPFVFASHLVQMLFRETWRDRGLARRGYSAREFFNVLRDGFDVPKTTTYTSCFVEVPGMFCEMLANKMIHGAYTMPPADADAEQFYYYNNLYVLAVIAFPLMWLLSKIDSVLLFVFPGNNLIAQTKRRVWRERKIPILVDGRSIAEAAINTKIGTAAPF